PLPCDGEPQRDRRRADDPPECARFVFENENAAPDRPPRRDIERVPRPLGIGREICVATVRLKPPDRHLAARGVGGGPRPDQPLFLRGHPACRSPPPRSGDDQGERPNPQNHPAAFHAASLPRPPPARYGPAGTLLP